MTANILLYCLSILVETNRKLSSTPPTGCQGHSSTILMVHIVAEFKLA